MLAVVSDRFFVKKSSEAYKLNPLYFVSMPGFTNHYGKKINSGKTLLNI